MKKLSLVLFLFITIANSIFSQEGKKAKQNYQFGKISQEEIQMKVYPLDSTAEAVVLGEKGEYNVTEMSNRLAFFFKSYRRIKLLKKSSFDEYGNFKFGIYTKDHFEMLIKLRAAVIQPDGTRKEFKEKDFFTEKSADDFVTKKIAFPDLKEGCTIEYEYEVESQSFPTLKSWNFQDVIPVFHSEIRVETPAQMEYVYLLKAQNLIKSSRENGHSFMENRASNVVIFSADSLVAMKPEAYITTMQDYIARIDFHLSKTTFGGIVDNKLANWTDLARTLYDDYSSIGKQFTQRSNYKDIWNTVKPMVENLPSDDEKVNFLYKYLSENVNWIEDDFSIYADKTLNDAFEKKKANSGELNMMLLACLKELQIKALPLLVSTREHGVPITFYPIRQQFNHLLCYIDKGDKSYLVDVGNIYRPVGTPRIPSLNGQGWLMSKDTPTWITMTPSVSAETTLANFELAENGTLSGHFSSIYKGYSAVKERGEEDDKHDKVKKSLATNYPDIQIDSISVSDLKNVNEPFKRKVYCSIANAATTVGDYIYIKPTLKTVFDQSPFKQPKREYSVDFPFGFKDQFVINLTIPADYVVEEMPKSMRMSLSENGGSFQYVSSVKGNTIQLMMKINLEQLQFSKDEYSGVKTFFDKIAEKSAEQIVLKKKQ